jgi:lysophospholipase
VVILELVATPANPIPGHAIVARIITSDGIGLRVARWRPTARPVRGTVCVLQGRAEFIEKYFETIAELRRRGFAVVTFDWRGQGGSDRELANPRKGHIDDFLLYRTDLATVVDRVMRLNNCPFPHFALAHSMGAAILLHAIWDGASYFERVVALAPMVKIAFIKATGAARLFAEMLDALGYGASFIPGGGETSISTKPFAGNRLSTDPVRYARNALIATMAPHLAIGDPTVAWIDAAFRCMRAFEDPRFARSIATPTLVIAAADDPVVSTPAVERFAARLKAGHAIVIPGARHEILMERDSVREAFWAAFDAFIPGTRMEEARSGAEALQR